MKALRASTALLVMRSRPLWRLLAADKAPLVMGLLQSLLLDQEKSLSSSIFHERLAREIDTLRAHGHDLPQTHQAYVADWIKEGWLSRRFPPGASEEEFELTAEAASALRFLNGLLKPRTTATESRLATVIQQLTRLAEETDTSALHVPKTDSGDFELTDSVEQIGRPRTAQAKRTAGHRTAVTGQPYR